MAGEQELDFEAFEQEVEREVGRLKRAQTAGGLAVGKEVISTVLPLLKKLARMVGEFAEGQEDWSDSVDEQLEELVNGGVGGGSYLIPEHHHLFSSIVSSLETLLNMVLSAKATPPEMREQLKPAQAIVAEATKVLEELEPAEDDEEEEGGEDEGDDEARGGDSDD